MSPWLAAAAHRAPASSRSACGLHAVFACFRVTEFTSLLVTFGLTVIIESLHPVVLDGRLPALRDALRDRVAPAGAAVRARARAARLPDGGRAGARPPGPGCASPMSARRCGPAPRIRPWRRPSASITARQAFLLSGVSAAYAGVAGRVHRADLHAGAGADLGVARRRVRRGHHRRPRQSDRRAAAPGSSSASASRSPWRWWRRPGRRWSRSRSSSSPARAARVGCERARRAAFAIALLVAAWHSPALAPAAAARLLRVVPLPHLLLDRAGHELEHPQRLRRLLQLRPRRVLRRGRVHDGDAHRGLRGAVPRSLPAAGAGGGAAGGGHRRRRLPRRSACAASCSACSRWPSRSCSPRSCSTRGSTAARACT